MSRDDYEEESIRRLKSLLRGAKKEGVLGLVEDFLSTRLGLRPATQAHYAYFITALHKYVLKAFVEVTVKEFTG